MIEGAYSNLVAQVSKAMFSDDDDQSEMLAGLYLDANQAEKWSCPVSVDRLVS